ncbi:tetratricopeptide repeat protein [Solitalea sp. MAHUQ-68]|uniref:Tetratricopeptide repeat protein n=1 Tax=Solitalea agri TaxID=2953739 RepID=A0A9X2JEZ0_9SPHI|nr:tetratricopeptide repeat protein [Solitalea agri]MCO4294445.1 tetratricopeptide repeat protein [Solitalea agri]
MISTEIEKVGLLIMHKRYAEAIKEIHGLLASQPDNSDLHYYMAICNLHLDKNDKATENIKDAIALEPDNSMYFYTYSKILLDDDKIKEADEKIQEAIHLFPYDANYFGIWANILMVKKEFEKSLEKANEGLSLDPENHICLNLRSMALVKLNRGEEAAQTIDFALENDPENAFTHANYGWGLLEQGNNQKALEHFRESLKLNPNSDYARAGMVEAIKSKYLIYKWFLQYRFWLGNKTKAAQWGFIIGFYLLAKLIGVLAEADEGIRILLTPVIILIALFTISTWIITPVSNLFLRLNVYGRYALDKNEIKSSNLVGISILVSLIAFTCAFFFTNSGFLVAGILGFTMMIPFSTMFRNSNKSNLLLFYTLGLLLAGVLGVIETFYSGEIDNTFSIIYMVGFIAYQWVANYIALK